MLWYSKNRNQTKPTKNPKTKQTKRKTQNNSPKTKQNIVPNLLDNENVSLYIFLRGRSQDLEKSFLHSGGCDLTYLYITN